MTFCTSNGAPSGVTSVSPVLEISRNRPRASEARRRDISWTRVLVALGVVEEERSWESFARRQGWVETWTLEGREATIVGIYGDIWGIKRWYEWEGGREWIDG